MNLSDLPRRVMRVLLDPRWVVDDDGDPGVAFGRGPLRTLVSYYKWDDTFIARRAGKVDHRPTNKRELNVNWRPSNPGPRN